MNPHRFTFLHTFLHSVSDTEYYVQLRRKSFWFSLQYLFFFLLLFSLLYVTVFAFGIARIIPKTPSFIEDRKKDLAPLYPQDLVLTIERGELSTNAREPIFINMPAYFRQSFSTEERSLDRLLTIDTHATADDFESYHTMVLVTKRSLVTHDGKYHALRIQSLQDIVKTSMVITRKNYDQFLMKIDPFLNRIPLYLTFLTLGLLFFGPFIGALCGLIVSLLYLLFAALVTFFISLLMKRDLRYGEVYRLCMHGISLSLLYGLVETMFHFTVPFGSSIVLLIWMILVLRDFPRFDEETPVVRAKTKKHHQAKKK